MVGSKTAASTATIPISKALQDDLAQWEEEQRARMRSKGMEWKDSVPIVSNAFFEPMPKSTLSTWWYRSKGGLGFPSLRFHDLRHAFVAHCCMLNVNPKAIQKLARHSTFSVTMDIYAAVNDKALDDAVSVL